MSDWTHSQDLQAAAQGPSLKRTSQHLLDDHKDYSLMDSVPVYSLND